MERKKKTEKQESYEDEMIEIEYMLATMGTEKEKDFVSNERRGTTVSDSEVYLQRRAAERKRIASLVIAMGIEADLPSEFYEKLAKSRRAKILLRSVVNDKDTASLIRQLYK